MLIPASHPPDFGRVSVAKTCFSVQSTTHFNQQPVPPLNEILLKTLAVTCFWKLWVCFRRQTSSRVFSSCCSALLTLASLVRSHYWLFPGVGEENRSSWSQGALLLKSHYWFYYCWNFSSSPWMGQLWELHWGTLPCFPKGSLFLVFLFRSSLWLVTHIWVSENGKSFRSLLFSDALYFSAFLGRILFRWILLEDKHHTLTIVTSLSTVIVKH